MRIIFIGLGLLMMSACADPQAKLRVRSAYDLKCPAEQLKLVELTPCGAWKSGMCTIGVSGCGRQATYVDAVNGAGDWVMNNSGGPR